MFLIFLLNFNLLGVSIIRLEEVMPHPFKEEIYINQIVTHYDEVMKSEKIIINRILLREVGRESIEIMN